VEFPLLQFKIGQVPAKSEEECSAKKTNSKRHVKLILELLVIELIQEKECVVKSMFFTRNQIKYVKSKCRYFEGTAVFYNNNNNNNNYCNWVVIRWQWLFYM